VSCNTNVALHDRYTTLPLHRRITAPVQKMVSLSATLVGNVGTTSNIFEGVPDLDERGVGELGQLSKGMNRVMHAMRQEQLAAEAKKFVVRTAAGGVQPWNAGIDKAQLYPPSAPSVQ
jgi:HAMP domain